MRSGAVLSTRLGKHSKSIVSRPSQTSGDSAVICRVFPLCIHHESGIGTHSNKHSHGSRGLPSLPNANAKASDLLELESQDSLGKWLRLWLEIFSLANGPTSTRLCLDDTTWMILICHVSRC